MDICKKRAAIIIFFALVPPSMSSLLWRSSASAQGNAASTPSKKAEVDEKAIRALINQLADNVFEVREAAQKRLTEIGEPALEALKKAAKENGDAEAKQRLGQLIQAIQSSFFVEVRRFEPRHHDWISRLAVTPNGQQVVAALRFGSLRSWNVPEGKEAIAFEWSATIPSWALTLSRDGNRLLVGSEDRVARIFDMKSGKLIKELKGHTGEVSGAAFLPDGKRALTGGADRSLRVWDVESAKELRAFENVPDDVHCLAVSPDGKLVAVGHTTGYEKPGTIRLWDLDSGREVRTLPGHTMRLCSVCFSADGKMLLSSSIDKTVRLWDVSNGQVLKTFQGHTGGVEGAVFTIDGKRVLSIGNEANPVVMMWDVASGALLFQTAPTDAGLLDVVALPDGRHCLTSGKDGVVRLWLWKR